MNGIDRFVEQFVNDIRDDSAAIFAGAGLSIPAGLVDWHELMRSIAEDVGLDVDKETDLISVAQFHVNERRGRHRINEALVTEFAERACLSKNHEILARLPIRTFWTTNYDSLIEHALRTANKRVDVKHSDKNIPYTLRQRDAIVYKMHGDVSQPDEAVITRDDYELYATKRPLMSSALQGDLVSKTFLFLGFSFSDPNLNYVLGRIRVLLGENRREHYCLLRSVHEDDFKSREEYEYARLRQDLQISDLRRYGVQALLLNSYSEYTTVLEKIENRFRRRRVFVSSSAATFAPFSESEAQELIKRLGKSLIEAGFDVISGFGLGVGPYLLNGALEGLGDTGTTSINDRIVVRPFPQGIANPAERAQRWGAYRNAMIAEAGIAIFLFGNKLSDGGQIQLASGVEEEFTIALRQGLVIVPIEVTGYSAKKIRDTIRDNGNSYYDSRPEWRASLEKLDSANPANLINLLMEMMNLILEES